MFRFLSPEVIRIGLLAVIVNIHVYWTRLISQIVPEPYLDEVFHIPQAQAYWAGDWSRWDPKITTPPGLYAFSYAVTSVKNWVSGASTQTTTDLRSIDFWLLYVLLVLLYVLDAVSNRHPVTNDIWQREFNIVLLPLLFFFSGLFYTDLLAVCTVILTYICWSARIQSAGKMKFFWGVMYFLSGHVALAMRQTNFIWIVAYLGGLQVIETVKDVVKNRQEAQIFDEPVSEAWFEDYFTGMVSILSTVLECIPKLLQDLWPQLSLLGFFLHFLWFNGGVALGDKENHVLTIHFAQMLYIWPFMVFFSWPILLPRVFDLNFLRARLPRPILAAFFMIVMGAVVYFNTIVHPFTLADNRHYVFYVFRILLRHPAIRYLSIPIYFFCAWLVLNALGGSPNATFTRRSTSRHSSDVRVSFVLVWLISTSLTVITAPLVEPRYFIIPWLLWRLHVPNEPRRDLNEYGDVRSNAKIGAVEGGTPSTMQRVLSLVSANVLWLELAWFLFVNYATGHMFLYEGFEWPQEPGRVQRFMW